MSGVESAGNRESRRVARAEASVWLMRLHGDARTPEMEAGLREWLAADPEHARQFEHMTEVWELGGSVDTRGLPRMRKWRPAAGRRLWKLAAAAIVCAVGLFAAMQLRPAADYSTEHGEQRLVHLADGSRVTLNSDTHLSIDFTANARRVRLSQGEAYFEVVSDPAAPFTVQAGDSRITALGTSFVVRQDAGRTAVTLVEGKVAVDRGQRTMELSPGNRVVLAPDAPPKLDAPRLEVVTAWRRGEVLLEATPLPEAIAELNRYDERRLVIDDPRLASMRVSGIYRTGDSPGFARAIAQLHGLEVIERGDSIHLRRAGP